MHRPIRRWFRIALWLVPFLAFGAGSAACRYGPPAASRAASGCCARPRRRSSASPSPPPRNPGAAAAPSPAPAQPARRQSRSPLRSRPCRGCRRCSTRANLYSAAGANMLSPAVAGALSRVYVPNLRSNDVYVIDPATRQVVDRFPVGFLPQHVVPSWDLQTLWVANNGRRRSDGSLTPIDPKTGPTRPGRLCRRPLQYVFHPRRIGRDRRRRAPEAARFP